MKTMEKIILQLQQEMKSTKQELMSLKQGNGYLQNLEISELKKVSLSLKETVAKLQNGYDSLKQELAQVKTDNKVLNENNKQLYMRLQSEISACNNKTLKISEELDKFTHSTTEQMKNVTELNANVNSLNQKTDTINVKINSLTSSSKARGQDFLALLNKTITAEKKIVALVTENKKVSSELNHLSYNQNNTIQKIDEVFHKISDINQTGIYYFF
jgi:chromosome segregation ATPase